MDFCLVMLHFLTSLAVNAKDCVNSNLFYIIEDLLIRLNLSYRNEFAIIMKKVYTKNGFYTIIKKKGIYMITLKNISKYYHSDTSDTLGLRNVNLTFSCGEFVVITGEKDSGKTTLLNIISGLLPYEEGELRFEGKPTSRYKEADWEKYRKEHIAFISQSYSLIDNYTVLQNVMAVLLIQKINETQAKETSMEYLEQVGLSSCALRYAYELSNEQKQRLAIAKALAKNTPVIVADEPTENLDKETGKEILKLLSELAKTKLVLIVLQNQEESKLYATRKLILYDGEVIEDIHMLQNFTKTKINTNWVSKRQQIQQQDDDDENTEVAEPPIEQPPLTPQRIASIFTKMNVLARKKDSLLFTILLCLIISVSFLCFGNAIANFTPTNIQTETNYNVIYSTNNDTINYTSEKGTNKITSYISFVTVLVLLIAETFVVTIFLKKVQTDNYILKSMGMEQTILKRICFNTMFIYSSIAFLLMLVVVFILQLTIPQVHTIWTYYKIKHIIFLFCIHIATALLTDYVYHR